MASDFVPENISDAEAAEICDAFGLFGTPEECLARLKRAEAESGIDHVFIFPTHTQEGGYDMPRAEVRDFRERRFSRGWIWPEGVAGGRVERGSAGGGERDSNPREA